MKLGDFLSQTNNLLFCKENCSIIINLETYELNNSIIFNDEDGTIFLESLISRIDFGNNNIFDLILDYPVIIHFEKIIKDKEFVKVEYKKDDQILEVPMQKQDLKELVLYIERLLGGKARYKDINHLFLKFYKQYVDISDIDLVHMEILISQCLRDKNNPSYPARVGKDPENPAMMNIKKNVFNSGFLQGLAFENIGEAIKTGLISDTDLESSILEKVITGEILEKKEKD